MSEQPARTHALERTNAKGIPFIGRCILCGSTGLTTAAALEKCENPMRMSEDQTVLEIIKSDVVEG